ncbi:MAG: phosphotransferase [Proteobacteria bacterium]|nr:phosphotransferase [Pseudomonadota bacterium]
MSAMRIRTAFILGAGMGTRLRPLTLETPKPLLPVGGRPLITFAMDHCLTVGVERFIVNTHHCPAAYDREFPERSWRGWPVLFRHEEVLLDTAGGIKNIEDLLAQDETFLVYNGDVLSDLPLSRLLAAHAAGGKEATLALRSDGPLLNVVLDADGAVCDLRGLLGNPGVRRCLFTGIYALEKSFLRRLTTRKVESVVPVFAGMIREAPGSVGGVVIDEGSWEDIGDPEAYARICAEGPKLRYETGGRAPEGSAPAASLPPAAGSAGGAGNAGLLAAPYGAPSGGTADLPFPVRSNFLGAENGSGGAAVSDPAADTAAAFVRTSLGLLAGAEIDLCPVGRGGSDRDYCRVAASGRDSLILMRYGRLREENHYYAAIAGFLREIGVRVPAIFAHDPQRGLVLMEDLGDEDLFALRTAPWEVRRGLYEKTLALAARLHQFPPGRFPAGSVRLMPGFGPELYRWERDYFREQCVRGVCRLRLAEGEEEALEAELAGLAGRLGETKPELVHRDLQSQNVMIVGDEPVLIDFQGMRRGSLFYDLGSLLSDPYVELREEERTTLLRHYFDVSRPPYGWGEFGELFLLASAQRLMQALGAYGFLGLKKGKTHFLAHIPRALERLRDVAGRAGRLPRLHDLARRCLAVAVGSSPTPPTFCA